MRAEGGQTTGPTTEADARTDGGRWGTRGAARRRQERPVSWSLGGDANARRWHGRQRWTGGEDLVPVSEGQGVVEQPTLQLQVSKTASREPGRT
ncbi:hypothetical protein E2542_SST03450 [Spatholobus suberectus]|nr:hypothetical protein E2542_SST03450 [Spatholobus suberectus]